MDLFLTLQHQLRDAGDIEIREEVEHVASVTNVNCRLEWSDWIVMVIESFKNGISERAASVSSQSETVDAKLEEINQARELQGQHIDAIARRARRKSMKRRKVSFSLCVAVSE